jgi:hypothetical protein
MILDKVVQNRGCVVNAFLKQKRRDSKLWCANFNTLKLSKEKKLLSTYLKIYLRSDLVQDAWDDAVWNWAATVFLFPHGHESEWVTVHWVKKTVPGRITGSVIHWVFFQLSFFCQVGVHTPDWIIFRFFVIRYGNTTQCHITLRSSGHPYGNWVIDSILPVPPHLHFQRKPKLKLLLYNWKILQNWRIHHIMKSPDDGPSISFPKHSTIVCKSPRQTLHISA